MTTADDAHPETVDPKRVQRLQTQVDQLREQVRGLQADRQTVPMAVASRVAGAMVLVLLCAEWVRSTNSSGPTTVTRTITGFGLVGADALQGHLAGICVAVMVLAALAVLVGAGPPLVSVVAAALGAVAVVVTLVGLDTEYYPVTSSWQPAAGLTLLAFLVAVGTGLSTANARR